MARTTAVATAGPAVDAPTSFWWEVDGTAGLLGGTANVIVQLGHLPVGHGVANSTVDSGSVMLHPLKRLRTTMTYIAVALAGTTEERRRYRQAIDRQHVHVRSGPDDEVAHDAFDPELQLWVAACLYWGAVDLYHRMHGPMDVDLADRWFADAARFGTTLQVPAATWPPDRDAFARYWAQGLEQVEVDATVRAYVDALLDLEMLPGPVRVPLAPFHRWVSTGLLPPRLRDELGLAWSPQDERRLDRLMRSLGAMSRRLPGVLRRFPLNAYLADARLRMRLGRPLV